MLIPSIDLQGGRIVQLVQGEKLAVETSDFDGWIERFSGVSESAADRSRCGKERRLERVAGRDDLRPAALPGRRRHPHAGTRAEQLIDSGRDRRSSSPRRCSRDGAVDLALARTGLPSRSPPDGSSPRSTAAAVTSSSTAGARCCDLTPVEAVRALEPYAGRVPLHPRRSRRADAGHGHGRDRGRARRDDARRLTAAGGITTMEEVESARRDGRRCGGRDGDLHRPDEPAGQPGRERSAK